MRQRYSLHNVSAYASMRRWGKSLPGRVLTYFTLFCLNLSFIPAVYAQVDEPYLGLEEPIEYKSLSSLDVTSSQLGLDGPFSFGMGYGSLDRYSVNAQYTKEIDEDLAMSVLAEYGEEMYRLGATIGFSVLEHGLAKVSAERFSQLLPFEFDSGNIDEDVAQNAYGIRYQHSLDNNFMQNINFGAYYANAPNVALDPVIFDVSGVAAINYRNIAGATSTGLDMGSSFRLSPSTELSAQVYYDDVRYNTEFTDDSSYDGNGLGGELGVKQLLSDRIAVSAVGSVRELYDVYTVGISWLPPSLPSAEVALLGQRIVSQNETPDNNIVGLQVGFDFGLGGTGPRYALSNLNTSKDIEQWTRTPAVYMEQVLAISEQYSEFLSGSKVSEDATLTSTGPVITSISETTGPIAGGTELILLGTGFTDAVEVKFGEELGVDMVVVDDTQITVMTPAGEEGVVNVSVATPLGVSVAAEENLFSYIVVPTVTARSPTSGSNTGGTIVTLTGTGFIAGATVTFGGIPGTNVTVVSGTSITVTSPPHPNGVVNIIVTTSGGSSVPGAGNQFTYTAPVQPTVTGISPTFGPAAGGTVVTITGTNFLVGATVNFGGNPATAIVVNSSTQIKATSPAGTGAVNVTVTTAGGTSIQPVIFTYAPTVTSISPTFGPAAGGTSVTITGTGFTGATAVKFGAVNATSFTVNSSTQITATSPAGAGAVNVTVTTPSGTSIQTATFTYAPTVTSISPTFGPAGGGTSVTITGTGFTGATAVKFGATPATTFTVTSATKITATSPAGTGAVNVTVTTAGGTSIQPVIFTYAPTVTSISPTSGPAAGGTSVTITGTNFTAATAVKFGTVNATSFIVNSSTQITATSPAGTAPVNVTVTAPSGTSTQTAIFTYGPRVTAVAPTSGPNTGGTIVTLTGTGFTGATAVNFGTTAATTFTVNSATSITVTSPAHINGLINITVTTPAGTSPAATGNGFTYVTPPPTVTSVAPNSGPAAGGTPVTIIGTNFTGATAVKFGAVNAASFTVNSATQITATSPAGTAPVNVTVTTAGGTSTQTATFTYGPRVTAVAPTSGPNTGGTIVTLTGTGFTGATAVNFGTTAATTFTVNSATSITVTSPAHVNGLINITVTTPAGTSPAATGNGFTYINPPPTVTSVAPNSGSAAGGTPVTIIGTNFTGATAVKFGAVNAASFTVNSATQITATSPVGTGTVNITVTTASGTSATSAADQFTYIPAPTVTGVSPTAGPSTGGTSVIITGTNFTGATAVKFGATLATSYVVNSATQITATSPGGTGVVDITVTTPGGISATNGNDQFTYYPIPTVSSINPDSGLPNGGNTITVTGTGFSAGVTAVSFGNLAGTDVSVQNSTTLTVKAPPGVGSVNVDVTTPGGTSTQIVPYKYVPSITNLSPTEGPVAGGTLVTITGTGFETGNTTVSFGGTSVSANVISSTSLQVTSPSGSAGSVNVTVTTNGGTSSALTFTYDPIPTVTGVNPNSGSPAGGDTVTVSGSGFIVGETQVSFGGVLGTSVNVTSSSDLTVTTPAGVGSVNVVVTTPGGSSTNNVTFNYKPTVTSLSPTAGPAAGSTEVTINGSGFIAGETYVYFGNTLGTDVVVTNSNLLTVISPAGIGSVDVTVQTPGGTSIQIVPYKYVPSITNLSPTEGPVAGGTLVTITGTGFETGNTTVSFGGTSVSANVISSTSLQVTSPSGSAGSVNVTVTTNGGTSSALTFTYDPIPTVTGVNPNSGSPAGGDTVTVSGSGFIVGETQVSFGGVLGTSVNVTSSSDLTVTTPAGVGSVNVVVTTPGGSSTDSVMFNYIPTVSSLSPTAGPAAGSTLVTISGSGFVNGATTVYFGSEPGVNVNVVNSNNLTVESPSGIGVVNVTVVTAGGTSTQTIPYKYVPSITNLSPTQGPVAGGTVVTITGTGFETGNTTVSFGSSSVSATVISSTSLEVTSPSGSAGAVNVTVTTSGGTSSALTFTYDPVPTVIELVPAFGPEAGQTLVNIIGSGFVENNTQVYFGTAQGTNVNVTSPNTLTVTSPAGTGPVNVTVETPGGTSTETVIYTYTPTISSISPTSGPAVGSTQVTINGSGFIAGATTVNFGTAQGTSVNVTGPNSLTVFSPPGIGAVNVTVTTAGGTSTQIVPYNYVPSINNVSPIAGPLTGGELVTISGTGFESGNTTVNFGSNSITATVISSTQLTVISPAGSSGSVALSVTTAGGTSTESFTFTFEGPPTVLGLTPNTGPVHGGTSVTITGTNFVGASAVNFGDTPATFTYVSPTQIIATSPSHVEGAVFVTVTTPVGTSATSINSEFVYNPLVSIAVTPANSSIGLGTTTSFVATGTYQNGETKDLTSQVAWSSQNSQIASVNSQGYVQGVNAGTTTIIAEDSIFAPKSDPIVIGSTEVTVVSLPNSSSSSSLESTSAMNTPIQAMRKIATPKIVEPLIVTLEVANDVLTVGESMPVYAIAAYGDVTQNISDWVSWSSFNDNVAVVDNEGNITAIALGETQIIANFVDMTQVITIKVVSEAMAILKPKQTWAVQVGAFSNVNNALNLLERLHEDGYTGYVENVEDKNLIRVLVGESDEASQEKKTPTK